MSDIEWTEKTWNAMAGCSKVSPTIRERHKDGTITVSLGKGAQWTGEVRLLPWVLDVPLRRKVPTTYFVNSISDMFHESVVDSEEGRRFIAAMFGVMAACPQHTFQILTKRPEKAREWFAWSAASATGSKWQAPAEGYRAMAAAIQTMTGRGRDLVFHGPHPETWPLPNVWIGTSVEDQQRADERIPHLLEVHAALRFLSCEPLLGPLNLSAWIEPTDTCGACAHRRDGIGDDVCEACGTKGCMVTTWGHDQDDAPQIGWAIVGGESGAKARPCEVQWIRSIVEQCNAAQVSVFVKQLGSVPVAHDTDDLGEEAAHDWDAHTGGHPFPLEGWIPSLRDKKGGSPEEWPEELRVREMPR